MDANIPARSPIGIERLPPFLCRAPDKDKDKSKSPGIDCSDLKTPEKEKKIFKMEKKTHVD